jgi:hypothetical protein
MSTVIIGRRAQGSGLRERHCLGFVDFPSALSPQPWVGGRVGLDFFPRGGSIRVPVGVRVRRNGFFGRR